MRANISEIVKEAFETSCESFCKLVDNATNLICAENGKVGNLLVHGRLVSVEPSGEALVIGDLHGDLESLIEILENSGFLQKMDSVKHHFLVFLGDYGDRGVHSVEVYYVVLSLKLLFPNQVVLLRGNHEGPEELLAYPHDLPSQFQTRFGGNWTEAYKKVRKLFASMYNAMLIEERYLLIHGGLSQRVNTIEDLAYAHNSQLIQSRLEDLLWNDPDEAVKETCASPRGAGKLFGESVTSQALERFNVKVLIRGHEPCQEGFKINHGGKVLTIFSRRGPPYFNAYGAYLDVGFSKKLENAYQLVPYIKRF